jgi:hypothetical protein|tara:strand:- start:2078 stop:2347 length:270 start_codon:yes stop_codon:yes gene_type:complete
MIDQRENTLTEEKILIAAIDSLSNLEHFKIVKRYIEAQRETQIGALLDEHVISNTNLHYTVTGHIKALDDIMWLLDNKRLLDKVSLTNK